MINNTCLGSRGACESREQFRMATLDRIYEQNLVTWLLPYPKAPGVGTQRSLPRHGGPFPGPLRWHNGSPVTSVEKMEMSTGSCCCMSQSIEDPLQFTAWWHRKYTALFKTVSQQRCWSRNTFFFSVFRIVSLSHFNIFHLGWRLCLRNTLYLRRIQLHIRGRGVLKSLLTKAAFYYVSFVSRVAGYGLDVSVSIPDNRGVRFVVTKNWKAVPRLVRSPARSVPQTEGAETSNWSRTFVRYRD
jgi:hypothetical protein